MFRFKQLLLGKGAMHGNSKQLLPRRLSEKLLISARSGSVSSSLSKATNKHMIYRFTKAAHFEIFLNILKYS